MSKKALIVGITGQDGSFLAELLLSKGYEVFGVIRRSSSISTSRIDHIFDSEDRVHLIFGDLADGIDDILYSVQPDEVYNMGSMSHVRISFDIPVYTADITGIGALRILEGIKKLKLKHTKFYQASSSECFGLTPPPQNELSPFNPLSPYGIAKAFAFFSTRAYRFGYGLFACNGILFNHESERRGMTFVTRKITRAAARIKLGLQDELHLGNLNAIRDWGHARDYCFCSGTKILVKDNNKYHKLNNKDVKDIKKGDLVLSYNVNSGIKEFDTVTNTMRRQSDSVFKIIFSNYNNLMVTENHPIAVIKNGGIKWVNVNKLKIGDKVIQKKHFSITRRLMDLKKQGTSFDKIYGRKKSLLIKSKIREYKKNKPYKKLYGASQAEVLKQKISKTSKEMHNSESYKIKTKDMRKGKKNPYYKHGKTLIKTYCISCNKLLSEFAFYYGIKRCRVCSCRKNTLKLWKNKEYRNKVVTNTLLAMQIKPNKVERLLSQLLRTICPKEFKYVGDGKVIINGFNPDFINVNGKKKIIELFGDYWHKDSKKKDRKRLQTYNEYGYETLVVWEKELKNIEKLTKRIETFIFNPDIEVVTVKNIKAQNLVYDVYNFETEKNHNYFAHGILVHNCRAIHMIMQHDKPDDFVVATGEYHTVRAFLNKVFNYLNLNVKEHIIIDDKYRRPNEVPALQGDATKIRETLGWKPEISFDMLVEMMIKNDLKEAKLELLRRENDKSG